MSVHVKSEKFPCNFCDKIFTQRGHCNTHVKLVHEPTFIQCDICHKKLKTYNLNVHIERIHSQKNPEKQLKCDICDKEVFNSSEKAEHMRRNHENDSLRRNYICDICESGFIDSNSLKIHVKSFHEKIFELKCYICDRRFNDKRGLKIHVDRLHTIPQIKKCDICEATFKIGIDLKKHINECHINTKTACNICGILVKDQKAHSKKVHDTNFIRFTCDICDKYFASARLLRTHFFEYH